MTKKRPSWGLGSRISATSAARNFSELINRVRYERKTFVVQRGGEAVCEIRPVYGRGGFTGSDLAHLLRTLPDAPASYLDAVADGIDRQPPAEDRRWPR